MPEVDDGCEDTTILRACEGLVRVSIEQIHRMRCIIISIVIVNYIRHEDRDSDPEG